MKIRRAFQVLAPVLTTTIFASSVLTVQSDDSKAKPAAKRLVPESIEPVGEARPAVTIADNESFKATTNGTRFREGEGMQITLTAKADGYVKIYGFNDAGETVLVFPNEWDADNRITAGRVLRVPSERAGAEDYDLWVAVPEGQREVEEYIQIVFSPEPFTDDDISNFSKGEGFRSIGKTTKSLRLTKGLRPEAVSQVAEKTIAYEVRRD